MLHVILVDTREHDRIHGAGFFAEPTVDALEQVDIVAARAPRSVGRGFPVDSDTEGRTKPLPEPTGGAALLAVRITPLRMEAAESRRLRGLFLGIIQRVLGAEEGARGDRHALDELGQQQSLDWIHGHWVSLFSATTGRSCTRTAPSRRRSRRW